MERHAAKHPHEIQRSSNRLRLILLAGLGLCLAILAYGMLRPATPNAFDRPEAQVPNKLRSPWGVQNPF